MRSQWVTLPKIAKPKTAFYYPNSEDLTPYLFPLLLPSWLYYCSLPSGPLWHITAFSEFLCLIKTCQKTYLLFPWITPLPGKWVELRGTTNTEMAPGRVRRTVRDGRWWKAGCPLYCQISLRKGSSQFSFRKWIVQATKWQSIKKYSELIFKEFCYRVAKMTRGKENSYSI